MSMKLKTLHYINGTNVADMSADDCIACIADAEAHLVKLGKINANSTAIKAEVERIEAFIAGVVKHLDAK